MPNHDKYVLRQVHELKFIKSTQYLTQRPYITISKLRQIVDILVGNMNMYVVGERERERERERDRER